MGCANGPCRGTTGSVGLFIGLLPPVSSRSLILDTAAANFVMADIPAADSGATLSPTVNSLAVVFLVSNCARIFGPSITVAAGPVPPLSIIAPNWANIMAKRPGVGTDLC